MSKEDIDWSECPVGIIVTTKLETIHTDIIKLDKKVDKLNNDRLRPLENWRNRIIGAVSVLTLIVLPIVYALIKNWDKISG